MFVISVSNLELLRSSIPNQVFHVMILIKRFASNGAQSVPIGIPIVFPKYFISYSYKDVINQVIQHFSQLIHVYVPTFI